MMASDEVVRVEEFKVGRLMALGLGRYEAIRAVEDGVDWHTVEALVETGCPLTAALELAH